jgi:hypothetical protein
MEFPIFNKAVTFENSHIEKMSFEHRNDFFKLYNRVVFIPEYPYNKIRYFFNSEINFKNALLILNVNEIDYSIFTEKNS